MRRSPTRREALAVIPAWAAGSAAQAQKGVFPNPDWARPPERMRLAAERAEAYRGWLDERGGEYWAGVVIRGGYLLHDGRSPRTHVRQRHDCGSIKKPLQGTVLGAALHQGKLKSLDENALAYWRDAYQTSHDNDRVISFRQFATYRDQWNTPEPPGAYMYNNASATAAGACIAGLFRPVSGPKPRGMAEVVHREIMAPIGADWDLWYWERPFTNSTSDPGPRFVLEASVYELAKLGYLWLRRGVWGGRRIFSEEYYREATSDWSPNTGDARFGRVGHYGYWWFVNKGRFWLPDAPEDAFYHIGNGNPRRATGLLVIPSLDAVAVLGMERISDEGKWDVIQNSRVPSNDGMRAWAGAVMRLLAQA